VQRFFDILTGFTVIVKNIYQFPVANPSLLPDAVTQSSPSFA
jgi:hypothetical protein